MAIAPLLACLSSSWPAPWVLAASVPLALVIDHVFGELPTRWHPVVWIGSYLGWAGAHIAPDAAPDGREEPSTHIDRRAFWLGALTWSVGALAMLLLAHGLQGWALQLPGCVTALLLALLLKPLLAWRMLRDEVLAVEHALSQSLAAGRARLSRLVSRDVAALSESEVRESAIESLAENFNDSLVAPVFWFVLLGLPGAALYRFANTADAMWGYPAVHGGRYWQWAGKWAARADDVLSWIPARITAVLIWAVGRTPGLDTAPPAWSTLRTQARRTPSPNSGWPMAAMALLLQVRLQKAGVYTLNAKGRAPCARDTDVAIACTSRLLLATAVMAPAGIGLIALLGCGWTL